MTRHLRNRQGIPAEFQLCESIIGAAGSQAQQPLRRANGEPQTLDTAHARAPHRALGCGAVVTLGPTTAPPGATAEQQHYGKGDLIRACIRAVVYRAVLYRSAPRSLHSRPAGPQPLRGTAGEARLRVPNLGAAACEMRAPVRRCSLTRAGTGLRRRGRANDVAGAARGVGPQAHARRGFKATGRAARIAPAPQQEQAIRYSASCACWRRGFELRAGAVIDRCMPLTQGDVLCCHHLCLCAISHQSRRRGGGHSTVQVQLWRPSCPLGRAPPSSWSRAAPSAAATQQDLARAWKEEGALPLPWPCAKRGSGREREHQANSGLHTGTGRQGRRALVTGV